MSWRHLECERDDVFSSPSAPAGADRHRPLPRKRHLLGRQAGAGTAQATGICRAAKQSPKGMSAKARTRRSPVGPLAARVALLQQPADHSQIIHQPLRANGKRGDLHQARRTLARLCARHQCVFRTKSASDSDPNPPPFPIRSRHRFRPNPATTIALGGGRAQASAAEEQKDASS